MSEAASDRFARLIRSLRLREISPMELHSRRLSDLPVQGEEMQLEWKQAYADGDPVTVDADTSVFRPKYEFSIKQGANELFHQMSIFIIAFTVADRSSFDELWSDESVRKVFLEKQLRHTMWPILRQHVMDGMSRLGMKAVPLPWLV